MAVSSRPFVIRKGRKYVKGIEHGLSGYTNYGCRCEECTDANSANSQQYRDRKFAGEPLCVVKHCPRRAARSAGNGLCYRHHDELMAMRRKKALAARKRKLARTKQMKAAA